MRTSEVHEKLQKSNVWCHAAKDHNAHFEVQLKVRF